MSFHETKPSASGSIVAVIALILAGLSVVTMKAAEKQKEIERLYRVATRTGETQGLVKTQPLMNFLASHPDPSKRGPYRRPGQGGRRGPRSA